MKRIVILFLSYTFTSYCQDTTYNHFSIDAEFGLNNPIHPMTGNYDAATLNLWHVGLGFRYAINTKFGVRLSGGYDQFKERAGTPPFSSEYYRVSLEGVANLGNIMDFKEWTKHIGLLFHMGAGYSVLNGSLISSPNHMLHGIIGFTPQIKLSPRFSINIDGSVLANIYQNYTYDLRTPWYGRGIDGYLINLSLGVQYNFGRKQHADWVVLPNRNAEIESLKQRVEKLENQQRDDDGDGVANWLDEEPATPPGTIVDTKGRTAAPRDSDSDNIPDDVDDCPFEKGSPEMKGCPENSAAGTSRNNSQEVIAMIEHSQVKFETDKTNLSPSYKQLLKAIATVMKDNPSYKIHITGHADDRASEEYNMTLSKNRAESAKAYLIEQGVSADRITTEGKGESAPINPLTTVEGRAENRCIEFDIR